VANAHENAAESHQSGGGEAELFGGSAAMIAPGL
jgi:hypothetical protein